MTAPGQLRPFFPYYGSKWSLARHMPAPKHSEVIEVFAGAAGYSTYRGAERVVLVDKDPVIAGVWDYLLHATPDGIMALPDLPAVGDSVDDIDAPPAAKWLIGFWLNRGSATPKRTRTAYSARSDRGQLNWSPRAKERIASQLHALRDWSVTHAEYDVIAPRAATWIVDPPYQDKGRFYRQKFTEYEALGRFSTRLPGQVLVSEGADAKWLPFEPLGTFKTSTGSARELIWIGDHS